ncbi:hypothetical protein J3R30DRAFT_3552055 [Lentinula aciculospora]|uniref:Uncharacterized protein n=1 Tax=Lentinula aciculospora TaxID=153920 RepID=A0A9W8ZX92_9AGAR|nr:hypothetical protein J3R30DRAFT_3552055 [Lentinula aciculospora]
MHALVVFASYFVIIAILFGTLFKSLLRKYALQKDYSSRKRAIIFSLLATGSFIHTWYYMFRFMEWSFKNYEFQVEASTNGPFIGRLSKWLANTALFEQAWLAVCSGPIKWWLSEQLCSYTVGAWTIFIFVEGKRHKIEHAWTYMLLGQLVAISVASNLFYVALCLSTTRPTRKVGYASPVLWLSTLLSLLAVSNTPFTDERTFLPNLLVMHTLAAVPLLFGAYLDTTSVARFSLSLSSLHFLVFMATASIHTWNSLVLYRLLDEPLVIALWTTLFSHPAQSSIGWDIVWTSVSYMVWIMTSKARLRVGSLLVPLVSVGAVAPALVLLNNSDVELL